MSGWAQRGRLAVRLKSFLLFYLLMTIRGVVVQNILATGWLKKKDRTVHSKGLKYMITPLCEEHLPVIMALQECIIQNLGRSDLLQPFSCDFMRQHILC